jgi:hypothetical protein
MKNNKIKYICFGFLGILLQGCGSEFENSYKEGCTKEGKYSSQRCKCVASILDKSLSGEQKKIMLNPGDVRNLSKLLDLIEPSLNALDKCQRDGK